MLAGFTFLATSMTMVHHPVRAFVRLAIAAAMPLMILAPGSAGAAPAEGDEVFNIWPGAAPGTEDKAMVERVDEVDLPGSGKTRVKTAVNVPTLTVFRPAAGKANGAAVVVLPGGGFGGLAWDLEGIEPAQWLAERGITAFLLKYRVGHLALAPGQAPPKDLAGILRMMEPGRVLAVADAAQAMKLVRSMAGKYGIDPARVGMIGFSAGGIATLGLVLQGEAAVRPNFAAPVYAMPIIDTLPGADAPPLFLVHAQDDPVVPAVASSKLFEQWQQVRRPAEAHLYSKGGHGFGMRLKDQPVGQWPEAFHAWMKGHGLLDAVTAK